MKVLQQEHKHTIYYSLIKVLFYNMFLSVGYFQMFKCDRKASSNNVPLGKKFQKMFCPSYGMKWNIYHPNLHSHPGARLPCEFTGFSWADTCLSWRVRYTTESNQNDGRTSLFGS